MGSAQDRIRGLVANFKFSNGLGITFNRLFRRDARAQVYIWKGRLFIVCNCARQDHISVQEIFAGKEYLPFLEGCGLTRRVRYVNVGANIGAFDLWMRDRGYEIAGSLAVELNPLTYQRCLVNFQNNGLTETTLLNCGVAGADGELEFSPSEVSVGDNIFAPASASPAAAAALQRVELVSLRTLLERHAEPGAEFDLLKLDCEGAEYQILRQTPADLLRRFRHLVIEFHPEPPGESVQQAYDQLHAAGFRSGLGKPGAFLFLDRFSRE